MAQNWIKLRKNLKDDPRVIGMAAALGVSVNEVLGALVRWFGYADEHSADGTIPMVDHETIDSPRISELPGLANQLVRVGWLAIDADNRCVVINFDDHMGASAKRRSQTAKRAADYRARQIDDVTHRALPDKRESEKEKKKKEGARSAAPRSAASQVSWSVDGGFSAPDDFVSSMRAAYPDVNIESEMRNANAWLIANPDRRKSRYARFLNSWFKRSQGDAEKSKPRRAARGDAGGEYDFNFDTEKRA